jgi:hypothetical protein
MITAKINVTKILKQHLYQGKQGKYLDLIIWENKDGPDDYGNTHIICQSLSKEARERGEKRPIIGNLKLEQDRPPARPTPKQPAAPADDNDDPEVPF